MSIVYSHISDKHIDLDACEAVQLSNGDYVAMDDDYHLKLAYERGLISMDEMMAIGFDPSDLN